MDRRRFLGAAGMLALFSPAMAMAGKVAAATQVLGCHVHKGVGADQFVLELSGQTAYRMFTLSSPPRVVIDLQRVSPGLLSGHLNLDGTAVAAIRSGPRDGGLRVVLDMRYAVQPRPR